MNPNSRLEHLDALRGLAILLVVYVHLVNYGLFDLRGGWMDCMQSPAVLGLKFRMPLFFFISGLLACAVYDRETFARRVHNRLTRQLWPTVAVCLLFNAATEGVGSWHNLVYNPGNDRYWFTQSLVQTFMAYALVARMFDRLKVSRVRATIVLAIMTAALIGAFVWVQSLGKLPKGHFLSYSYLNRTVLYAQFFLAGVIARMWYPRFAGLFDRFWPWLLSIAVFAAGQFVDMAHTGFVIRLAGVFTFYGLFHHTASFWASGHAAARVLKGLGRNTLPIYLYHYILLYPLLQHKLLLPLQPVYGTALEMPVLFGLSLAMAGACVGVDQAMRRWLRPVHTVIYRL